MEWGNLRNWFAGDRRLAELRETRRLWTDTEALWRSSPLGQSDPYDIAMDLVKELIERDEPSPSTPVLIGLHDLFWSLLRAEDIGTLDPNWDAIETDARAAVEVREMLTRRRRWATDYPRMLRCIRERFLTLCNELFKLFPEACFRRWPLSKEGFGVPLIELIDRPNEAIQELFAVPYDDEALRLDLFEKLRGTFRRNLVTASGFRREEDIVGKIDRLVYPNKQKGKTPKQLSDMYLTGTPFAEFLETPVPFDIPDEARFEHCHIVGGTGHGKTQLMQRMIYADLIAAQGEPRSVLVIDSQGDLINKLSRLALFDPEASDSLAERLVLVDPSDIEFPAALNLFDAPLSRLSTYGPVDRERVLNGVVELYETFFGAMLGAELTQKQGVIFRYLARLMVSLPGASIRTLMQLMEDGHTFRPQMEKLDGSARHFFETEFFHPSFAATKKQILRRLWGVLSTPAFERMFAQKTNKLDLFGAMNEGKIILISTAKDLLKQDGSALFGRFFIAMIAQAALERSVLPARNRTPTFVYIDEAQEYFDDSIETILNQARKFRVGLTLAHQTLDQLSPRLRSSILANTSVKCAGGVSAKDARGLADELRTTSEFIESMRRRGERSEFAVWVKHQTGQAVRLSVPLGFLEQQPLLSEEAYASILEQNRTRYCGTLADIEPFTRIPRPESLAKPERALPAPAKPRSQPDAQTVTPSTERAERIVEPEVEPLAVQRPQMPREPKEQKGLGKGGSQHRYVQHLIKGLAEARGYRAVIEAPVEGGQVDVALYRDDLSVACEISVTSTTSYEVKNLAKCLRGKFTKILAVASDAKRLKAMEAAALPLLSNADRGRVAFLTPDRVAEWLDAFGEPSEEATVVRGYKVKIARKAVSLTEAQDRRSTVARVIAQSLRGLPKDD